jgi:superfamily II DNA or RNA helicase
VRRLDSSTRAGGRHDEPSHLAAVQWKILEDIEKAFLAGYRRPLVVLPTGAGKTVVFAEKVRLEVAKRGSVLVIAHRREIIHQTSAKLTANGVVHGIIMAGEKSRSLLDVQLASVATLFARGIRREVMELPPATLGVIDEAHHTPAHTYQQIVDAYPDTRWLGFTATPERGDGRGLGGFFDCLVEGPQVQELINLGFLVPTRVYAAPDPDLRGVKTVAGDYVKSQLEERMDKPKLVGDIVQHWFKHGEGRKAVVFASGVGHSVHIRDEFLKAGVKAAHIDGKTLKDERDATLAQLAHGEITVVTNCMVLTEGWDCPDIGCIILARPTQVHGALPPDDRPRAQARARQVQCDCDRPRGLRLSARVCRGPRGVDARAG